MLFSKHTYAGVTALATFAFSTPLCAQDNTTTESVAELEPMVVTASRRPRTTDDLTASVDIITAEDITLEQPQDLVDLLQNQAGVHISRTGGRGTVTSVNIRGGSNSDVLVLIDGVPANTIDQNAFAWTHMPPSQIERIEIVRGPGSVLYGAQAVSGVIQIFTKQPTDSLDIQVAAGSDDYRKGTISAGTGTDTLKFWTTLNYEDGDGISATNSTAGGSFRPDRDGFENTSVTAGVRKHYYNGNISLQHSYFESDAEFDAFVEPGSGVTSQKISTLTWQHDWSDTQSSKIVASYDDYDYETTSGFIVVSKRERLDLQHRMDFTEGSWILGGEFKSEEIDSSSPGTFGFELQQTRDNAALFSQWSGIVRNSHYVIAIRHDHNQQFGDFTTGKVGLSTDLNEKLNFDISYSTAFVEPNFFQLFFPNFSNPDLEPEEAKHTEASLSYSASRFFKTSLTYYYTELENEIVSLENIAESTRRGVEWRNNWQGETYTVDFNLTLARAYDRNNVETLKQPEEKANLSARFSLAESYWVGGQLRFVSYSFDNDFFGFTGRVRLGGFAVADLYTNWQINESFAVGARLDNIFDREYSTTFGYNSTDRNLTVTARYSF